MNKLTIGSSIICMDHINFERDVLLCRDLGVDYLHLDVMDGHAVPRYGIYPEIVRRMAEISNLKMDLHLMIQDVSFGINQFSDIDNIEYITFHYQENKHQIYYLMDMIRANGCKPGLVFNLSVPASEIAAILELEKLDAIMFMGIHPGVLKQRSRPENVLCKLGELNRLIGKEKLPEFIQIDGGVTFETIEKLKALGVNNFVCGSSTLYKNVLPANGWNHNKNIIQENYSKIREILGELSQ